MAIIDADAADEGDGDGDGGDDEWDSALARM